MVCIDLIPWCDCSEKIEAWTKYNKVLKTRIASVDITVDENYTYRHAFIVPDICHHIRTYESINNHIKDQLDLVPRDNPLQKQVPTVLCAHICIDSWSGIGGVFRFNQRTTHRNTGTPHANLSSQAHACVICAACQGFVRAMGAGRNFFESSDSNCNAMDWIRHRVACQLPRHN